MHTVFALYLTIASQVPGGASVRIFAGVLAAPALCQMAGAAIKAAIEADAPGRAVTVECRSHVTGVPA